MLEPLLWVYHCWIAAIPMVKDAEKIYDKITRKAENLVKVGEDIEKSSAFQ